MKTYRILFLLISITLLFTGCDSNNDSPSEPVYQSRGMVVSTTFTGNYSASLLQSFISTLDSGISTNITLQYDVESYKVVYLTADLKGNLVNASGALFIPKNKDNLAIGSFHHGTQASRGEAPSQNPLNALDGLIGASIGYFSLDPDYLGLGESTILHPYIYAKSSADAVIDFIRAGRNIAQSKNITLNGQVFLAGYSEGGYVTLAAHNEIEKNYGSEIVITACAPMAGPYDINLTSRTILQNQTYSHPGYIAYLFLTYNDIYGWNRMNDIFASPYAQIIPSLFDGIKTLSQINDSLTDDLSSLLNQNFVNSYLNGNETAVTNAFEENSLLDWTPLAPIRLYHGNADEQVPYQNSVKARDSFISRGANVELITIEGGTHESAAIPSIIGAIEWFESIRLQKANVIL